MEEKSEYKKGLWTVEEDRILKDYIKMNGKGKWNRIPKVTGLKRCGKSCRLRWINYLSPGVKRGDFSEEENDLIIRLHNLLGNRWSLIAGRVPGRTDNQVKNHWNTHLSKKLRIKKEKNKNSVSSQILSASMSPDPKFTMPQTSTSDDNNYTGDGSQNVITRDAESQTADDFKNTATQWLGTMNDDSESSPWFFLKELNLHTPTAIATTTTLMELLDESLEFVWHGL